MKPSMISWLFFIILSLAFINISYANCLPPSATKLYEKVCRDTGEINATNPCTVTQRCLKLLKPYPKITSAKDYVTLCKFILEMAIEKGIEGQNYFKKVMKKNPSSKAIKLCATNNYDGMIYSFKSSLSELVESPITANYDAKVAGDGPDMCASLLADEKISNPALSTLNNEMSFLSEVAFFATNHLPGQ